MLRQYGCLIGLLKLTRGKGSMIGKSHIWPFDDHAITGFTASVATVLLKKYLVKNEDVKRMLKNTVPGEWKKVYDFGRRPDGKVAEIHYFQHSSGKVVDVAVKRII